MFQVIREFPLGLDPKYEYLSVVAASFLFFTVVYRFVSPYFSKQLSAKYVALPQNHKIEWNVRVTSTIFSVLVSSICLYVLIVDHALSASPLFYDSDLVKTNIAIVMGYAISDMIIILLNYKIIGDAFTLFHHCLSLYGYSHALAYSVMPYFANFRLIVELSTPLVNMRWFLYATGYPKDSIHFFVNGIVMTALFFTVRIASIPIYWYKVYTVLDSPLWAKMRTFRYIMIVTCLALDVINVYWFRKMFKGALIVWNTNWQYYEKHHKAQQLERLGNMRKFVSSKLTISNSAMYQSTVQRLQRLYPANYMPTSAMNLINLSYYYDFIHFNGSSDHHQDDDAMTVDQDDEIRLADHQMTKSSPPVIKRSTHPLDTRS